MQTLFLLNMSKSRRLTSTFFPIINARFFCVFILSATDQWTDGQTDKVSHRVACPQLKKKKDNAKRVILVEITTWFRAHICVEMMLKIAVERKEQKLSNYILLINIKHAIHQLETYSVLHPLPHMPQSQKAPYDHHQSTRLTTIKFLERLTSTSLWTLCDNITS